MGKPLNKRNFGNVSTSGQQITATAYFSGDTQARSAYISKQESKNTYDMTSLDGRYSGRVTLVTGNVALVAGQANISVTTYTGVVEWAKQIDSHIVETFQNNVWVWVDSATSMTSSNQAQVRTS